MTTLEQRLQQQIETAVHAYLLASRASVAATLERAFGTYAGAAVHRAKRPARVRDGAKVGKRRTASELAALSEQLYQVISENPGQGMVTLSERIGLSGHHLQRVVALLRADGRIRSVGSRQQMRYFLVCVGLVTPRTRVRPAG
jgi:hypothetical protein